MLLLQASHFAGRILFLIFSLWYLNRFLGLEAKGVWAGLYALMSILGVAANMGFEVWLTRAVASKTIGKRHALSLLFRLKGITWILALIVGFWFVYSGGHPFGLAIPFGVALILDGIAVSEQAVFEGLKKPFEMAVMSFLKSGGFVILSGVVILMFDRPGLADFGWTFVLALGIRVAYGWRSWTGLPNDILYGGAVWRECILMGAWTLATVVYFSVDGVMLLQMAGAKVTGAYSNAYNFVEGSLFISAALGAMLYPRLVQAEPDLRGVLFDRAFALVLAIAACGVVCLYLLGPVLGQWMVGEVFETSVMPLFVLAWCLPFMFANGLLGRWLLAHHREAFALKTALVGAILNIIGNAWLIPEFGAQGAAVMTLITEGLLFLVWLGWGRRRWNLLFLWLGYLLVVGGVVYLVLGLGQLWLGIALASLVLGPLGIWSAVKLESSAKIVGDDPMRTDKDRCPE